MDIRTHWTMFTRAEKWLVSIALITMVGTVGLMAALATAPPPVDSPTHVAALTTTPLPTGSGHVTTTISETWWAPTEGVASESVTVHSTIGQTGAVYKTYSKQTDGQHITNDSWYIPPTRTPIVFHRRGVTDKPRATAASTLQQYNSTTSTATMVLSSLPPTPSVVDRGHSFRFDNLILTPDGTATRDGLTLTRYTPPLIGIYKDVDRPDDWWDDDPVRTTYTVTVGWGTVLSQDAASDRYKSNPRMYHADISQLVLTFKPYRGFSTDHGQASLIPRLDFISISHDVTPTTTTVTPPDWATLSPTEQDTLHARTYGRLSQATQLPDGRLVLCLNDSQREATMGVALPTDTTITVRAGANTTTYTLVPFDDFPPYLFQNKTLVTPANSTAATLTSRSDTTVQWNTSFPTPATAVTIENADTTTTLPVMRAPNTTFETACR